MWLSTAIEPLRLLVMLLCWYNGKEIAGTAALEVVVVVVVAVVARGYGCKQMK